MDRRAFVNGGVMHNSAILVGALGAIVHGAALADAKAGEGKAILCDLCHNAGDHDGGLAPLLQAQPAPYLEAQLRAFKDGRRKGGVRAAAWKRMPLP
jgi:cytochrome c553